MFYVRMPYMWVWILTSLKEFRAGKFWDVMIDQESHILWQAFEDFNVAILDSTSSTSQIVI